MLRGFHCKAENFKKFQSKISLNNSVPTYLILWNGISKNLKECKMDINFVFLLIRAKDCNIDFLLQQRISIYTFGMHVKGNMLFYGNKKLWYVLLKKCHGNKAGTQLIKLESRKYSLLFMLPRMAYCMKSFKE